MKKIAMIMSIIMLVFFSSCSNNTLVNSDKESTERNSTTEALSDFEEHFLDEKIISKQFVLNLSPEELLKFLEQENIVIKPPPSYQNFFEYSGTVIEDGRFYNYDGSFYYQSSVIEASFSQDSKLVAFFILTDQFSTEEDVCVGDSKEKMLQNYGENFIPDTFDEGEVRYYHYQESDWYLQFHVEDHLILSWGFAKEIAGYE